MAWPFLRDEVVASGIATRVAAFTSVAPGADLVRLATGEPVDLVLATVGAAVLDEAIVTLLEGAPCDVALHVEGSEPGDGPVMVPFGAATHDWAALELAAWLARGTASILQVIGATSDDPEVRDASRLLADASLIVQRATGVVAEPCPVSRPGAPIAEVRTHRGPRRRAGRGLARAWARTGSVSAGRRAAVPPVVRPSRSEAERGDFCRPSCRASPGRWSARAPTSEGELPLAESGEIDASVDADRVGVFDPVGEEPAELAMA